MDDADEIRLTLPASPGYARVARLAVAGLASRNGFGYDDVEDLRIATGEVFGLLVADDAGADARVRFVVSVWPQGLRLTAERDPSRPLDAVPELSRTILGGVVEDVAIDRPQGRVRLGKRFEVEP